MLETLRDLRSPLFEGIRSDELGAVLSCVGYHVADFRKGQAVALEDERIRRIGIPLSGAVDMVKEDLWGNKTMLVRIRRGEVFGESFAWGDDSRSVVTYLTSEDSRILFLQFSRLMRTCTNACDFHSKLVENMVRVIANKNRDLMRKVEVISRKTLREKILTYLSQQAQLHGTRYFEIPLGRLELADYLCADRTALTRELARMKAEGVIDYERNVFRLLDL